MRQSSDMFTASTVANAGERQPLDAETLRRWQNCDRDEAIRQCEAKHAAYMRAEQARRNILDDLAEAQKALNDCIARCAAVESEHEQLRRQVEELEAERDYWQAEAAKRS